MPYILLACAIGLELVATTFLKISAGFTKLLPTLICMCCYFVCFFCFSKALNGINLGVAYATWSGVGIVASAVISAVLFHQGVNLAGVLGMVLILIGCVIVNLFGQA